MKRLFYYMTLLASVLLTACTDNETIDTEELLPDGMGRIRLTICSPETVGGTTRSVSATPWEDPDHEWERLQTFRILICKASNNEVVQIISGTKAQLTTATTLPSTYKSATVTSQPLEAGSYYIYATANYNDGYSVGSIVDLNATVKFANGYSATSADFFGDEKDIPMTGKLTTTPGGNVMRAIGVSNGVTADVTDTPLTVWRVMAKMQFEFTNETSQQIKILGIEVDPINQAYSGPGIYLFSKDNLESINNLAPQTINETDKEAGITATWGLHDATLQTAGIVSKAGLFSQAQLSYGAKLVSGELGRLITAEDISSTTLYTFKAKEKVTARNDEAAITVTVQPESGFSFRPTRLQFKACKVGTNGGNFDVVTVSGNNTTILAEGEIPARYNGNNASHEPPFISTYDYNLNSAFSEGAFSVKIYIYDLDENKEYAFSDIIITGAIKSTETQTVETITLPAGTAADKGTVKYEPQSPLELNATNGTGNIFFYVNETDATYTTTNNELSLRFKIQRQNGSGWHDEEIRYGFTTHHDLTSNGIYSGQNGGFNVIRRNDWIHIPVHITDWQFRIEPVAFVPIAGYPATTLSSDALRATFSTGGPIILQPFAQKNNDGSWRDFSNPEVTFVSLSWKNNDGTNVSGDGKIITTPFTYDSANHCIIGELNNSFTTGTYKTTVTVNVKLGPSLGTQYDYSFTFNVVLKKTTN